MFRIKAVHGSASQGSKLGYKWHFVGDKVEKEMHQSFCLRQHAEQAYCRLCRESIPHSFVQQHPNVSKDHICSELLFHNILQYERGWNPMAVGGPGHSELIARGLHMTDNASDNLSKHAATRACLALLSREGMLSSLLSSGDSRREFAFFGSKFLRFAVGRLVALTFPSSNAKRISSFQQMVVASWNMENVYNSLGLHIEGLCSANTMGAKSDCVLSIVGELATYAYFPSIYSESDAMIVAKSKIDAEPWLEAILLTTLQRIVFEIHLFKLREYSVRISDVAREFQFKYPPVKHFA